VPAGSLSKKQVAIWQFLATKKKTLLVIDPSLPELWGLRKFTINVSFLWSTDHAVDFQWKENCGGKEFRKSEIISFSMMSGAQFLSGEEETIQNIFQFLWSKCAKFSVENECGGAVQEMHKLLVFVIHSFQWDYLNALTMHK